MKSAFAKILSVYLIISLFALTLPAQGWAMVIRAEQPVTAAADLATVRTALESSVVKQRLLDYGLTPEEATSRLSSLSDEQLHQFATQLDALQAGGDVLGDVIVILLVVVLVVLILELTGHHVVVRR